MDYADVATELGRLQRIAKGWAIAGKMDIIERDLVLQRLKELYEQVLFTEAATRATGNYIRRPSVALEHAEEIEELNITATPTPPSDKGPEPAMESTIAEVDYFTPIPESPVLDTPQVSRPAVSQSVSDKPQSTEPPYRRSLNEEAIRSLYKSDAPVSSAEAFPSIRWSVGINDRYLLIRDLFDGEAGECDRTLERLDRMPNIDAALLYIADNFDWNPDSEGARMFVRLLNARFS